MTTIDVKVIFFIAAVIVGFPFTLSASGKGDVVMMRLAVTPSIHHTGLLARLLDPFEKKNREKVVVIPAEPSKAAKMARNGEVDAVLIDDPLLEDALIKEGFGVDRAIFMHSSFMILGPPSDPAKVAGERANYAFFKIYDKKAPFLSTGIDSPVYTRENILWERGSVKTKDEWYQESNTGMYETLVAANIVGSYTLTEQYVYAIARNWIMLKVLSSSEDLFLRNNYCIIAVNPRRFVRAKYGSVSMLIEYLRSKKATEIIDNFRINNAQVFYPGGDKEVSPILAPSMPSAASGSEGG